MTLALSDPTKGLDPRNVPIGLERLFAPLIEIQNNPEEPENPTCHLCHSTVQEFLTKNPDVLLVGVSNQVAFSYTISRSQVGDLCLRYLSQKRFSTLMELPLGNCDETLTLLCDAQKHGFLLYCAKYWNKHLEDLKPTPELRKWLRDFLGSPNFQTLLQVQSLFVMAQFSQFRLFENFTISQPMNRPNYPRWFGRFYDDKDRESANECLRIRYGYQHFVKEWGYLLERSSCINSDQKRHFTENFWGEVDRCLIGLLGPTHFMNRMKERYPSFMLTRGSFEYCESKQFVIAEAVCASTLQFIVMSSPSQ